MLQGEHSAIPLTFIKLTFLIKIFVLSIFEWPFFHRFYCTFLLFHHFANFLLTIRKMTRIESGLVFTIIAKYIIIHIGYIYKIPDILYIHMYTIVPLR